MSVALKNDSDAKEEIRARVDLVSVIGEVVALKRAGNSFKGLCPFHQEKSPSFTVNPERGLYKCFGCGESGDLFSFVMKTQNLSFVEALRELARRAGITLSEARSGGGPRDAILDLNARAAAFFAAELASPRGQPAREYLVKRGIGAAETEAFGLGLAPDAWDGFLRSLPPGIEKSLLDTCGLFRKNDRGGHYDLFRDRIIFPIQDAAGRVVAFGARSWKDKEQGPKYINSPETPVYVKGRHLYGIQRAKDAVKRTGRAVLVEGYTDVIIAHKHGFTNVLAALGTALTLEQVTLITRLAGEIILAYDPDAAGRKAAERGIDIALDRGLTVRIAVMAGDKDPADALEFDGPTPFGHALAEARDFLDHRIAVALTTAHTPVERAMAAKALVHNLSGVTDRVIRATLVKTIADRLGVPENALVLEAAAALSDADKKTSSASESKQRAVREEGDFKRSGLKGGGLDHAASESRIRKVARGLDPELTLIRLILDDAGIRARAASDIAPADFSKPVRGEVFAAILAASAHGERLVGDLGGRVSGLGLELLAHIATVADQSWTGTKSQTGNQSQPGGSATTLYDDYLQGMRLRKLDADINDCTVQLKQPAMTGLERMNAMKRLSELVQAKSQAVSGTIRKEGSTS